MQKRTTITILSLLSLFLIIGCNSNKPEWQTQYEEWISYAKSQVDNAKIAIQYFEMDQSTENFNNLVIAYNSMDSDIDYLDSIPTEDTQKVKQQQFKIDSTKNELEKLMEKGLKDITIPLIANDDWLIEKDTTIPLYLTKGTTLYYNIESSDPIITKIYNADTRRTLKSYSKKTNETEEVNSDNNTEEDIVEKEN